MTKKKFLRFDVQIKGILEIFATRIIFHYYLHYHTLFTYVQNSRLFSLLVFQHETVFERRKPVIFIIDSQIITKFRKIIKVFEKFIRRYFTHFEHFIPEFKSPKLFANAQNTEALTVKNSE